MDNNAVETLAVNTVIESIVLCNYLEPYISDKDKQPSWDGNVYIYKSPQKRKDNILGRIPAQVKGSQLLNPDAECVTFAVDIADLRNYLGDGGLLYFVVAMSHDGAKRTLYYRSFATVNLQMILAEHGMQQTVSLDFSRFPTDSDEKARLCMNLWEDLLSASNNSFCISCRSNSSSADGSEYSTFLEKNFTRSNDTVAPYRRALRS